jgi:hypothetical protein
VRSGFAQTRAIAFAHACATAAKTLARSLRLPRDRRVMTNKVGRPRKAESYRRLVIAALAFDPKVPTLELLRRATAEGYDGKKSAFYALVASTREPSRSSTRKRDPLPGESSRHDLVEAFVPHRDGGRRRTRLFVTRLEYSRFVVVSVLQDDGIEAVARALVDHFGRVGGLPLLATFDARRLGDAAKGPLAHLALDLGFGIELLDPPKTRASSSRIARMIRDELLPPLLEVQDDADLVRQIDAYTAERNARIASDTGRTPLSMLVEERRRLRPLKVSLAELTLRFPVVVQPGGIVRHEGREYALSPRAAGESGVLFLGAHQVRIVAGSFTGTFARFFPSGVRNAG